MLKREEAATPDSCWNKAKDDDLVFVLIEGDPAAPVAIREWVRERIRLGKNTGADAKIGSALWAANTMEALAWASRGTAAEEAKPCGPVCVLYTNHRGEAGWRRILPGCITFRSTEWHPKAQWIMEAWDLDKKLWRSFAMASIHRWEPLEGLP